MNFDENIPIYLQISILIKEGIVKGDYKKGDKLPSVREFSMKLSVNPNTVQRAYQELELDGIVFTKRGMGTFVSEDDKMIKNLKKSVAEDAVNNFLEKMDALEFSTEDIIKLIEDRRGEIGD